MIKDIPKEYEYWEQGIKLEVEVSLHWYIVYNSEFAWVQQCWFKQGAYAHRDTPESDTN